MKNLYEFIVKASAAAYAGGAKPEKKSERPGFVELVFTEGDFYYRDSYVGFHRSRGMEVVRFKGKPIWASNYGGGMVKGKEKLALKTFNFLKNAMLAKDLSFQSFRGPKFFKKGDWKYQYQQTGNTEEFAGDEKIFYKDELVFFHHIIGGEIK